MSRKKENVRRIQHYHSAQKILLVGEGDFSFSACLARAFRSAVNMVATSLHSEEELMVKHWSSEAHLETLERLGCLILHEVDVYEMSYHPTLSRMKFDVVVFNFPHAGHFYGFCEKDEELIEMHKELVAAFFENAREMLNEGGEVHVTHRDDHPYNTWELEKLAAEAGLKLKKKVVFLKEWYPGYHNKRGGDINCNKTFPLIKCFTSKFVLKENHTTLQKNEENHSTLQKNDEFVLNENHSTLQKNEENHSTLQKNDGDDNKMVNDNGSGDKVGCILAALACLHVCAN